MTRKKRYHHPGCFYHVMLRGNHGQDIFFSDRDRFNMCFLLQQGVERYSHRIHAYCFMRNHIHILIQVGSVPLSKIIQNLAFRYTQKINRKNKISGHLFQGRFKAILIEDELYFTKLLRYIHRNPIRAGITDSPEKYIWSSHSSYVSKCSITWLTCDYGLSKFAKLKKDAMIHYSSFVQQQETQVELDELRKNFKDGQVLGEDTFLELVRNQTTINLPKPPALDTIIEIVCSEFNIDKKLILSQGKLHKASLVRAMISVIAVDTGNIPIAKIAKQLNRHHSAISALILRFNTKYANSDKLQLDMQILKEKTLKIARCSV